jgi:sialate O-acetylesterase
LDTLDTEGWIVCNEGSVRNFTAVGYFFARDLAERMRIPIGLINSSWGGSQVESWISAGGMRSSPLFKSYMEQFPKTWEEADAWLLSKIKKYAFGSNRPNSTAQEEAQWMAPDFDLSKWPKVFPTYAWDWQQLWAFRGSGMMAVDFNLEEQDTGADATLRLGHGDLPAEIWINGRRIWRGRNAGGIEMAIPASVLKTGTNRLVYRQKLANTKDWAEMGMRGGASDFLLKTRRDQTIPLDGYWRAVPLLSEPFYFIHSSNNLSTAIYNAMIHPIVRFPVAGVIWYQGETNAVRAEEYRTTFPLLIQDWRQTWNKELPFLFVQLANWQAGGGHSRNGGSEWAELREAQAHALHLPGTGMAVAIDIGESNDIHPRNKHDVGRRLAREARRVAYNERLLPGSPVLPEWTFSGDRTVVKYAVPLSVHGSANLVNGFELAGEDRIFHAARAEVSGNTVIIQSEAVPRPVAVRYAWADDPTGLSLYTWDDFPIAPFRSDDWPRRTAGVRFE